MLMVGLVKVYYNDVINSVTVKEGMLEEINERFVKLFDPEKNKIIYILIDKIVRIEKNIKEPAK